MQPSNQSYLLEATNLNWRRAPRDAAYTRHTNKQTSKPKQPTHRLALTIGRGASAHPPIRGECLAPTADVPAPQTNGTRNAQPDLRGCPHPTGECGARLWLAFALSLRLRLRSFAWLGRSPSAHLALAASPCGSARSAVRCAHLRLTGWLGCSLRSH